MQIIFVLGFPRYANNSRSVEIKKQIKITIIKQTMIQNVYKMQKQKKCAKNGLKAVITQSTANN